MTVPSSYQIVHLVNWLDVLRVRCDMRREEVRNTRELELSVTDDFRRPFQETIDDPIKLRDGIMSRVQLVAELR